MEIIKQGNARGTKIFDCSECGCRFKATSEEYKYIGSDSTLDFAMRLTRIDYYVCICPCCGDACIIKKQIV